MDRIASDAEMAGSSAERMRSYDLLTGGDSPETYVPPPTATAREYLDRLTALQVLAAGKVQLARGVWGAEALKELERDLDALTYAVSLLQLLDRATA